MLASGTIQGNKDKDTEADGRFATVSTREGDRERRAEVDDAHTRGGLVEAAARRTRAAFEHQHGPEATVRVVRDCSRNDVRERPPPTQGTGTMRKGAVLSGILYAPSGVSTRKK